MSGPDPCEACGVAELQTHKPDCSAMHRARVDLSADQLRNLLTRQAAAGAATPNDAQLLAALDRWSAGELV